MVVTPDQGSPRGRWTGFDVAIAMVTIAPFVVAGVAAVQSGTSYYPGFDLAVLELEIRKIPDQFLTVGPYSRFGWSHPGPALYYVIAPFYWVTGRASWSVPVAAACCNIAAAVGVLGIAKRAWGRVGATSAAVALSIVVLTLGRNEVASAWNPTLPLMTLLLFVMACAAFMVRRESYGWLITLTAAFLVQSHVGFLPIVAAFVALVAVVRVRQWWNAPARSWRPTRGFAVTAIVTGVAWFPAAWGTFVERNGNVVRFVRFFVGGDGGDAIGLGRSLQIVGAEWGPKFQWLRQRHDIFVVGDHWWPVPVLISLALAGCWMCRDAAGASERRALLLVGLVTISVSVVSVSRIVSPVFAYLTRLTIAVQFILLFVVVLSWGTAIRTRVLVAKRLVVRPAMRWLAVLAVAGLAAPTIIETVREPIPADSAAVTAADQQASLRTVTTGIERAVADVPVLVLNVKHARFDAPGIILHLERAGHEVYVANGPQAVPYGLERRVPCGVEVRSLMVVSDVAVVDRIVPTGPTVAHWGGRLGDQNDRAREIKVYDEGPKVRPC